MWVEERGEQGERDTREPQGPQEPQELELDAQEMLELLELGFLSCSGQAKTVDIIIFASRFLLDLTD